MGQMRFRWSLPQRSRQAADQRLTVTSSRAWVQGGVPGTVWSDGASHSPCTELRDPGRSSDWPGRESDTNAENQLVSDPLPQVFHGRPHSPTTAAALAIAWRCSVRDLAPCQGAKTAGATRAEWRKSVVSLCLRSPCAIPTAIRLAISEDRQCG